MIVNRYGFLRRLANTLHGVSPLFRFTKRISRPFKAMRLKKKIAAFALPESSGENDPLFTSVELETMNRCNGNCGFCPVNHKRDPRPFQKMRADLFRAVIDELAAIDYRGIVHLFSNNEPFLDTRIYDFAAYAKGKLPAATLAIYSNGTLLDVEKYRRIIEHLDRLVLDNYCTDYKLRPNLAAIARYIDDTRPELWGKTTLVIRYENEILTTRGGQAPNAAGRAASARPLLGIGCLLPTRQLVIRPDGKLSLCCNDVLGEVTLGDVSGGGLVDAWNSEAARSIRRDILRSRERFAICRGCDTMY